MPTGDSITTAVAPARRRARWSRRAIVELRRSGLVIAVVTVAIVAHAAMLLASRAINLDGSHSSLAPASRGQVALDLVTYLVSSSAALAAYVALVALAVRNRIRGLGRRLVLIAPILLQLALLPQRPWLSTDVLSYIAQGFVGFAAGGGNAYIDVPRDVLGSSVGDQLTALGWRPQAIVSPYGPLWTAVEVGVMSLTRDVSLAVVLMKLPALLASFGSAALIWKILGIVRPRLRFLGVVVFLWSPVVIAELAGEGHLDGVMVVLVLLGVWLTLRARPVASAASAALGVLTKYLPLVLLPAQLVYLWRTSSERATGGRPWRLAAAAVFGTGIGALLFAPFWTGPRTLEGLRIMGQPGPWPTVTGLVFRTVERASPSLDAGAIATILVTGGFALYVVRAALGVGDARSLLVALARTALVFVLIGSPVFYPWYAVLTIALVALVPETPYLVVVIALTATSRVIAPFVDLRAGYDPVPAAAYSLTTLGLGVCIAVAGALWLRGVWRWAATGDGATGEESAAGAG